jgi:hypothetical protein
MDLQRRIEAVAKAAAQFPWLGDLSPAAIAQWIELELGDLLKSPELHRYGAKHCSVRPLTPILHVVSGNTPHAALQSLVRALLVGAENWIKLPSAGLEQVEEFVRALPEYMHPELERELRSGWLETAEAVVVFGSDETIAEFSRKILPSQRFIAHGHKISFGLLRGNCDQDLAEKIARDIFAFDQLGCLSPQFLYLAGDSIAFARELAQHFARRPFEKVSLSATRAAAPTLRGFREEWKFRAATEPGVYLWESRESLAWTVVHDPVTLPSKNPLHGTIFVKPMPADLESALRPFRHNISTIGLHPLDRESVNLAINLGAQRICELGQMQNPPTSWHHDGQPTLANLVRYIDVEGFQPAAQHWPLGLSLR